MYTTFFLLYGVEHEDLDQVNDEVLGLEDLVKPPEFHANGAVVQAILLQINNYINIYT